MEARADAIAGSVDHHSDVAPDRDLGEVAWRADNLVLVTVGVDIGSSTSHLLFSRVHLRRPAALTSRFQVVAREVLHASPVVFTPYAADDTIDTESLRRFVDAAYTGAHLGREDVDTGAVILTGTALERRNARRIAELFAQDGGRFVCATAGHLLEARLAAHGSGAVEDSARTGRSILNVDVGGGTTKFALVAEGQVRAAMALDVGARIVTFAPNGGVLRIERAGRAVAAGEGIDAESGRVLSATERGRLGARAAELIVRAATRTLTPRERAFVLDGALPAARVDLIRFSGGVSDVLAGRVEPRFGDLAGELVAGLRNREGRLGADVEAAGAGIRSTVIGASQFTAQVSGNTLHLTDPGRLPLRDVPVLAVPTAAVAAGDVAAIRAALAQARRERALAPGRAAAFAVRWTGEPSYSVLRPLAEGLAGAHRAAVGDPALLVVACDLDVGATLGAILTEELGCPNAVVLDGLELAEFDHVDIGEVAAGTDVVPVIVKSLLFPDVGSPTPAATPI
jgi:ethanolamine utilization protein EutA